MTDPLPTRHDAIEVMAAGMKAMAKHADRVIAENADLKLRVAELTELIQPNPKPITRTALGISDQ